MNEDRIVIENPTDYAWPYVAVLQEHDEDGWHEVDAYGGDSPAEAEAELRQENRRAARVS